MNPFVIGKRLTEFWKGTYPHPNKLPVVPLSDGAGEVVAVGEKVCQFKKGDRVATLFLQRSMYGPMTQNSWTSGVGGVLDGALRQYGVFPETGLVRAPRNLNDIETATLPCAAVTAWNCLYGLKQVKPGEVVLTQGTGGVSMFALQVFSIPLMSHARSYSADPCHSLPRQPGRP